MRRDLLMDNEGFKTFLVSYRYDGSEWGLHIKARDFDDAKARLARLQYATVDGELAATIPASLGPTAPIITYVRNAFSRFLGRP